MEASIRGIRDQRTGIREQGSEKDQKGRDHGTEGTRRYFGNPAVAPPVQPI